MTNTRRANLAAAIMKLKMDVSVLKQITFDDGALTVFMPLEAAGKELESALRELQPDRPQS